MKNNIEQNNITHIVGRITTEPKKSHEIEGEIFYETILEVKRLSDVFDYIPITVSERILNGRNLNIGDSISVEGEFRSYNKMEDAKSKLILHVFVKDIYFENEFNKIDMENTNSIILTGYICKNPVFRVTPFKREICDALIAVNRRNFKSDYIPCIFWGRNARFMECQEVGTKISLEGRIQSRNYTKRFENGLEEEKVAYEISVSKLKQLEQTPYQKNQEYKDFIEEKYVENDLVKNI